MRRYRHALCALGCCAVAFSLAAPAQPAQRPMQPHVGQAGKDAVWLPTPRLLVEKMLDMAAVTPQDYIIDVGSGDGRIVIAAAKRGARALGIEYNGDLVELSRSNAASAGVSGRTEFLNADFFDVSLDRATVVTLFLTPETTRKLRSKLLALRPGTRIVSNTFGLGDWKPDETAVLDDSCASWCTALLWIVPAKVEGADAARAPFEPPFSRILAQERDDVYVLGAGNTACQVWTEARARKSAVVSVFSSWVQGYLTGAADGQAAVHDRIRSRANDGKVAAARRQYCSAHSDDNELCRAIALASRPREIMAAVSGSEVETWLDKWCAARPSETLFRGAQALTGELDMVTLERQQAPK